MIMIMIMIMIIIIIIIVMIMHEGKNKLKAQPLSGNAHQQSYKSRASYHSQEFLLLISIYISIMAIMAP